MEQKLLTYGLRENKLWHILDVENGLACNCYCPNKDCRLPLIAKNNEANVKAPHFAHSPGVECFGAYESALHLMAKEVLKTSRSIRTPDFHYDYDNVNTHSLYQAGQVIEFEFVDIEAVPDDAKNREVKPDAIGFKGSSRLFIEFAKTHFVDEDKKEKLKKINVPTVELNISNLILDPEAVRQFILSKANLIYWIINPKLDKKYREEQILLEEQKKQIEEQNKQRQEEERLAKEKKIVDDKIKSDLIAKEKYLNFEKEGTHKICQMINGIPKGCPIIKDELEKLKATEYHEHEVLKQIIDGKFWDGEYHYSHINLSEDNLDDTNTEKPYIIIEDAKHYYGSAQNSTNRTQQETENSVIFFKGSNSIKEILEFNGNCSRCSFKVEILEIDNGRFSICGYENRMKRWGKH